MLYFTDRTW